MAADFYYLKNIAGRRLVGLRWWNEANPQTGESHWVFESAPQPNEPGGKLVNATDKRFFWLALYCQPALWVGLGIFAIFKLEPIWLTLVGEFEKLSRKLGKTDWDCSDCARAYDYEHLGLLKMRQVQPGEWSCRERSLLGIACSQCGRCSHLKVLQQVAPIQQREHSQTFPTFDHLRLHHLVRDVQSKRPDPLNSPGSHVSAARGIPCRKELHSYHDFVPLL